ncbi:MAG TPA: hypothetical protein VGJ75_24760 [Dongiaceae bacterium]|jgi:hypothetical protein
MDINALTPSSGGQKSRPLRYPRQMIEGAMQHCAAASQSAGSSAAEKGMKGEWSVLTASR